MAMQPVIKPQETKPAPLPAYPVAPSSQTQTSSRGMTPPKAYAGVPKSVPHYADGTASVDPNSSPFMNAVHGFIAQQGAKMGPQSVSIPNAAANYFVRPANAQVVQPGLAVAPVAPVAPEAPAAPVTASTLMNNAPSALAHAAFGAPGLARPNAAPFTGTVAHGGDNSLTPDPSGDYDVGQVGAPYPSSPQQVALAAQHTGANAAALQNAAGAARDAIGQGQLAVGGPGQPQNVAMQQHALANPGQYSPQDFMALFRGQSFRHMAMIADAMRASRAMMPYDPKTAVFNASQNRHVDNIAALRAGLGAGAINPKTKQAWTPADEAAAEAQELADKQSEASFYGGYAPYQKTYPSIENQ